MHLAVPFGVDEAAAGDGDAEPEVVTAGTGRQAGTGAGHLSLG